MKRKRDSVLSEPLKNKLKERLDDNNTSHPPKSKDKHQHHQHKNKDNTQKTKPTYSFEIPIKRNGSNAAYLSGLENNTQNSNFGIHGIHPNEYPKGFLQEQYFFHAIKNHIESTNVGGKGGKLTYVQILAGNMILQTNVCQIFLDSYDAHKKLIHSITGTDPDHPFIAFMSLLRRAGKSKLVEVILTNFSKFLNDRIYPVFATNQNQAGIIVNNIKTGILNDHQNPRKDGYNINTHMINYPNGTKIAARPSEVVGRKKKDNSHTKKHTHITNFSSFFLKKKTNRMITQLSKLQTNQPPPKPIPENYIFFTKWVGSKYLNTHTHTCAHLLFATLFTFFPFNFLHLFIFIFLYFPFLYFFTLVLCFLFYYFLCFLFYYFLCFLFYYFLCFLFYYFLCFLFYYFLCFLFYYFLCFLSIIFFVFFLLFSLFSFLLFSLFPFLLFSLFSFISFVLISFYYFLCFLFYCFYCFLLFHLF